jgi:hypothetical protein
MKKNKMGEEITNENWVPTLGESERPERLWKELMGKKKGMKNDSDKSTGRKNTAASARKDSRG